MSLYDSLAVTCKFHINNYSRSDDSLPSESVLFSFFSFLFYVFNWLYCTLQKRSESMLTGMYILLFYYNKCYCSLRSQQLGQNPFQITFGDGILTRMSRDFAIFMAKHLAGYYLWTVTHKFSIFMQTCNYNSPANNLINSCPRRRYALRPVRYFSVTSRHALIVSCRSSLIFRTTSQSAIKHPFSKWWYRLR